MILAEDEPVELVQRSLDSIKDHVDGMYITITYKETPPEGTPLVKLLQDYGVEISFFKWIWDFAAARNYALEQVPKGKDCFIYWQDADDVLVGGEYLHSLADQALTYNYASVFFRYWYMVDLDKEGNVREILIEHKRERVIRNDNTFKWQSMLHEILIPQAQENLQQVGVNKDLINKIYLVHLTNDERLDKNLERNIKILEEQAKTENHKDPRTLIYLAKAYFDKGKFAPAEERKQWFDLSTTLFHEYLAGWGEPGSAGYQEGSGWAQERSTAWAFIGEISILYHNFDMAIQAFQSAIDEAPEFPMNYINLATAYTFVNQYSKAKKWLEIAMNMDDPDSTIVTTPRDQKTRALEVSYQINMHYNEIEKALEDVENLHKILPEDEEIKARLKTVTSLNAYNKACQSAVYLIRYLEDIKEQSKIPMLLQGLPRDMDQEHWMSQVKHKFIPPRKWHDNEIAILCGPGFEEWTPDSIEKGLGGSEEAVVYLSQELNKKGWKVTVYANPGLKAGDFDGVTYKQWWDVNPKDRFNVLILWRAIGFVDMNPKAKFTMLWMHDVPSNPDFTEERLSKVDKIAVLSEYHKTLFRVHKSDDTYEKIPDEKFFLTANGIPDIKVNKKLKRNNHRVIYSSSPDRGLPYLLKMWPEIIKEVPDAELHVYYGFEIFDKIFSDNPGRMRWKQQVMDLMRQPGVTYHGRIGHQQLAEEMYQSGIWAYPTDFTEISCITAMKAQTLGAIPVVTNFAALQETVRNGLKVDVDITTQEGQSEYLKALIGILKDEAQQKSIRSGMMEWAKGYFGWDQVADNWDELFRRKVQNPIIPVIEGELISV